jgi:hypothetical protein
VTRRLDMLSLAFGIFFLGAAGLWLAVRLASAPASLLKWITAGGLVVAGLGGIVGVLATRHRRHAEDPDR